MKKTVTLMALGLTFLVSSAGLKAMTFSIDTGSKWCFEVSQDFACMDMSTAITGYEGIRTGEIQLASGSHAGPPDGTESPGIDNPWVFFGTTGMHLTTSPVTVLSHNANMMTLDFSGWGMTINDVSHLPLASGAWTGGPNGIAQITCSVDCSDGDTYQLSYSATSPVGEPHGWGGIRYALEITGTVSAIPLPAAFWLFGSGLLLVSGLAAKSNQKYATGRKRLD